MTQAERLAKASDPTLTEAEARAMLKPMTRSLAHHASVQAEELALALLRNPNLPARLLIEIAASSALYDASSRSTGDHLTALGENPALPLLLLMGDFSYAKGEDQTLQSVMSDANVVLLRDSPYAEAGCLFPFPPERPSHSATAYAQWEASLAVVERVAFVFYERSGAKDHGPHSLYGQMRSIRARVLREDLEGGSFDNRYESFERLTSGVSLIALHAVYHEWWWRQSALSFVIGREVLLAQGRSLDDPALLPGFAPIAEALSPWKP